MRTLRPPERLPLHSSGPPARHGHARRPATSTFVATSLLVATACTTPTPDPPPPAWAVTSDRVTVDRDTGSELEGTCRPLLQTSTSAEPAGSPFVRFEARRESPENFVTLLEFEDFSVSATHDFDQGFVEYDSAGEAMTEASRRTAAGCEIELRTWAGYAPPGSGPRPPPPPLLRLLTARTLSALGEAPPGMTLDRRAPISMSLDDFEAARSQL